MDQETLFALFQHLTPCTLALVYGEIEKGDGEPDLLKTIDRFIGMCFSRDERYKFESILAKRR